MKFSDILKTIGLSNGNVANISLTTNHKIGNNSFIGNNIDRIYNSGLYRPQQHHHNSHHYQNPYQSYHHQNYPYGHPQMDIPVGNGYYYPSSPYIYNGHDIGVGYGMKYGAGSETDTHNMQTQMGSGYEHSGYGSHDPTGGGGYHNPHHHASPPVHSVPIHSQPSYDDHHHHHVSQPIHSVPTHSHGRSKSKGSSTLTALTLISFFFFINLLQNCLKEHMEAMNPTVMVMTAGIARNRLNKLTEISSRETTEDDGILIEDEKLTEYSHDDNQQQNQNFLNKTEYSPTQIVYDHKITSNNDEKIHNKFINSKYDYFRENDKQYIKLN